MVQRTFRGITVTTQKFNQLNKLLSSSILRVFKFGGFLLHLEELLGFVLSVFPTYGSVTRFSQLCTASFTINFSSAMNIQKSAEKTDP